MVKFKLFQKNKKKIEKKEKYKKTFYSTKNSAV